MKILNYEEEIIDQINKKILQENNHNFQNGIDSSGESSKS